MVEGRTSEKDSRGSRNEKYEEAAHSNGCFRIFCVRKGGSPICFRMKGLDTQGSKLEIRLSIPSTASCFLLKQDIDGMIQRDSLGLLLLFKGTCGYREKIHVPNSNATFKVVLQRMRTLVGSNQSGLSLPHDFIHSRVSQICSNSRRQTMTV